MLQKIRTLWRIVPVFLVLILSVPGCLPPDLNGEWKDYNKRWHVCFEDVTPGRSISISHKFLNPFVFNTGAVVKVRGDFDALNDGDQLPNQVTWTFGHFRKGVKLFEDSFVVPLDNAGRFPPIAVQLTSPITFQKNDLLRWSYAGINVPHDTDVRLNIKF
jgi:hypothetical protein